MAAPTCTNCNAQLRPMSGFCHHCGTGLVPELDAGADTALLCPACQDGHRLVSRHLGAEGVTVLECGRCAGLWLGHEVFRELVERAKKESLPAGTIPETPQQEAAKFRLPAGAHVAAPAQPGQADDDPAATNRSDGSGGRRHDRRWWRRGQRPEVPLGKRIRHSASRWLRSLMAPLGIRAGRPSAA